MIPEERRKQILDVLEKRKYVSVEELASLLYVSLPTVRRDLSELEREGVLTRTHGGASCNMADRFLAPFAMREKMNRIEKQQIANIAAGLIENGDTIFLSSGSKSRDFAKALNREYHNN